MMAVVAVVVLYAVAVGVWFFSAESAWKRAAKAYGRECDRYEQEEKLISEKRKWNELYDREKAAMPTFEAGKATDTVWLRKVEDLARTNLVLITSIDSGKEVEAGDVLELPIEVKSWRVRWRRSSSSCTRSRTLPRGCSTSRRSASSQARRRGTSRGRFR